MKPVHVDRGGGVWRTVVNRQSTVDGDDDDGDDDGEMSDYEVELDREMFSQWYTQRLDST